MCVSPTKSTCDKAFKLGILTSGVSVVSEATLDSYAVDLIQKIERIMYQVTVEELFQASLPAKKLRIQLHQAATLWNQEDEWKLYGIRE